MLRLRHTTNTANGLDFKGIIHIVTQFDEYLRSWTIPAGGHGLLDDNSCRWCGRCINALQIFVPVRKPNRKLTVFIGKSLRFKPALHTVQQGFRFVRYLHDNQGVNIHIHLQIRRPEFTLLLQGTLQQICGLIFGLHGLRKILIDNQHLLDKTSCNNFFLRNLDHFSFGNALRRSRTANNLLRAEILDNFICFDCVVLMALIHNDDKAQAVVQCVLDMFQKVCPFAVFESIVAFLREFLPVNKATVIFFKSRRHHIGKQLCLRSVDILIHFCLALFLKITFTGRKPYKDGFWERLYVLVHKVGQNNGLSAACRTLENNITCRSFHRFKQLFYRI